MFQLKKLKAVPEWAVDISKLVVLLGVCFFALQAGMTLRGTASTDTASKTVQLQEAGRVTQ